MKTHNAANDLERRVQLAELEVRREQREYEQRVSAYRWGTRRIVASAREDIAKLSFDRDEARMKVKRELMNLERARAERDRGYEA